MITRVALRNFKAFQDAEINLSSLNLFTGLNGMGKSTFIQSLLLLRQSENRSPYESKGLILKGGKNGLIDIGKGKDAYNINATSDFIQFEIDIDYKPYIDTSYQYIAQTEVLPQIESRVSHYLLPNEKKPALFNDQFTYLKAERIPPEHNYEVDNYSAVNQNNFLGYKGENVPLFIALKWADPIKLESVKHPKAKANNLLSNIDAWLNELTPGTHVISTYYQELDIVRLGYQFDIGVDVTPEFSPVNVGFGFTYILPVITAILSAEKGSLLIIENPESHLHPHGQAKLGELLAKAANDGVQIIIESHSDHILNGIRVAVKNKYINSDDVSIFYFERDENSDEHSTIIKQPTIDENGRISDKPKGFFDEYANQLDELIH